MTGVVLANMSLLSMGPSDRPYGGVVEGVIAIQGERIVYAGEARDVPPEFREWPIEDLGGRVVTPAPIDCHTHLVFAGSRADEFERRLEGATYEEVARAGGGILSTVSATRNATEDALVDAALPRLDALMAEGVATVEVKSGYGLDRETELKMLRAARGLGELRPVRVRTTYLGAHTLPPEFSERPDAYIEEVCLPTLDAAAEAGLVDAVDGFCETIGFSAGQLARVFARAEAHSLPVKLHAEQLSNSGGTLLAAQHHALSADHLEWADEDDVAAMAAAGTVAVLLPGAFYTLRETRRPPVDALRRHGVPIAVATDCNPGSSPLTSILLATNMACTLFRLTPEEALAGVTRNAARALGLTDAGVIAEGMRADIAVWDVTHPAELCYRIGFNPLHRRIFGGQG